VKKEKERKGKRSPSLPLPDEVCLFCLLSSSVSQPLSAQQLKQQYITTGEGIDRIQLHKNLPFHLILSFSHITRSQDFLSF
jgi:hypothetical protein